MLGIYKQICSQFSEKRMSFIFCFIHKINQKFVCCSLGICRGKSYHKAPWFQVTPFSDQGPYFLNLHQVSLVPGQTFQQTLHISGLSWGSHCDSFPGSESLCCRNKQLQDLKVVSHICGLSPPHFRTQNGAVVNYGKNEEAITAHWPCPQPTQFTSL